MLRRKTTLLLVLFIICIILFDALQQKYYLETFSLAASDISFPNLFKNHFVRWVMWAIVSVPFSIIIRKNLIHRNKETTNFEWSIIFFIVILSTIVAVFLVSLESMLEQNTPFNLNEFLPIFIFFIYQKGLAFCFTFVALTLILFNQSKELKIEAQTIVIESLEKRSSDLKEALKTTLETEPHLNVKTGYKIKPIPLSEIIWIQSDDYCVKIHTNENSFTLRQSLKALEEKLFHYQFIRIHRGALLNTQYLDEINYEASTLTLTDQSQLPISKSGAQMLKRHLEEVAV